MMGLFTGVLGNPRKRRTDEKRTPFYRDDAFWRGLASTYDFYGGFGVAHHERDPWRADYEALRGDWEAVGGDMRRAMRRFEIEYAEELAGQGRLFDPDEMR